MPKALPRKPHCDAPDWRAVAKELDRGAKLRTIWRAYAERAARPYTYHSFRVCFGQWRARNEEAEREKTRELLASWDASQSFWQGLAHPKSRVIALMNYNCALRVRCGELHVWQGGGRDASGAIVSESTILSPGDRMPSAIAIVSYGGLITLEAIRFCARHAISVIVLEWPDRLIDVINPEGKRNASLVRRQCEANPVRIAREIVARKIDHGAATGYLRAADARVFKDSLGEAKTLSRILEIEAKASRAYSSRFAIVLQSRKEYPLPANWRQAPSRAMALGPGPKRATRPLTAMLNFSYALHAGRLAAALRGHGACLSIGYLHSDKPGRMSLAYDALEPLRPMIDAALGAWIARHKFSKGDFIREKSGQVTLNENLAKVIAAETALSQREIDRAAQFLIGLIGEG